jgi:hypothetical protein
VQSKQDPAAAKEAEILRSYWLRDDLDENEKFLREYDKQFLFSLLITIGVLSWLIRCIVQIHFEQRMD